jgi:serine/threonine-protein kinase
MPRLASAALSVAVAACSGPAVPTSGASYLGTEQNLGSSPPAAPTPQPLTRAGTRNAASAHPDAVLYVTGFTDGTGIGKVFVYPAKAKDPGPKGTITDGIDFPTGDCIDANGTLYVTNDPESGLGWVSEYHWKKRKPFKIVTNGIATPAFCAIDANGDLWVTNFNFPGSVAEYRQGSSDPSFVITDGVPDPVGVAIDHSGNIYVANRLGQYSGNVVIYVPGGKKPVRTITDGVTSPVGIAVDAKSTLYVTNINENDVKKYRLGANHPYQSITDGVSEPIAATVNKGGWLYVTNFAAGVTEYASGSIKPSKREIIKGLYTPTSSAYWPPLLP